MNRCTERTCPPWWTPRCQHASLFKQQTPSLQRNSFAHHPMCRQIWNHRFITSLPKRACYRNREIATTACSFATVMCSLKRRGPVARKTLCYRKGYIHPRTYNIGAVRVVCPRSSAASKRDNFCSRTLVTQLLYISTGQRSSINGAIRSIYGTRREHTYTTQQTKTLIAEKLHALFGTGREAPILLSRETSQRQRCHPRCIAA